MKRELKDGGVSLAENASLNSKRLNNEKLVYSIVLYVALCIICAICVNLVNPYKPIEWDISMGITFRLSIMVLFIALFLEMWMIFYVLRKYIYWLPILIPVSYWVNNCNLFPYRFIVFIVLNIVAICLGFLYYSLLSYVNYRIARGTLFTSETSEEADTGV